MVATGAPHRTEVSGAPALDCSATPAKLFIVLPRIVKLRAHLIVAGLVALKIRVAPALATLSGASIRLPASATIRWVCAAELAPVVIWVMCLPLVVAGKVDHHFSFLEPGELDSPRELVMRVISPEERIQ
jgi:hypothetical protein